VLLIRVENLKVKTKYERHYILLCMISTLLIKVRALCDNEFQQYEESDAIKKFSSHKILRLLEILSHYKDTAKPPIKREKIVEEPEVTSNIDVDSSQQKSGSEEKTVKERAPKKGRLAYRGSPKKFRRGPQIHIPLPGEAEPLCGLVFVSRRFTAQVLYNLLNTARNVMPDLSSIVPQYTASLAEEGEQVKDLEKEHRKQEEVLKRYFCNVFFLVEYH